MTLLKKIPEKKYSRVISLVPSQTELLSYLGLDKEVIGITKFCVHPTNWFHEKSRVGGTKNLNIGKIHELSPDLIIANKEENLKEQVEELAEKYDVWVTDVDNLSDALQMIEDVGKLTGTSPAANKLMLQITNSFSELKQSVSLETKIRTAYFIWKDPFMVAAGNTFINDMMNCCGLENIFSEQSRYPQITLEQIKEKDCRLLLLSSEPYPFKIKHVKELQDHLPGIRILLTDGEMFSWYGSRLLMAPGYFKSLLNEAVSHFK